MPKATALKQYVTAANKLLSAYGKSFHWARYFLGKEAGLQATQLYAFCRYLDDIADQPDNLGATKLKSIQNIFNNYSYQTGSYPEVDNFLLLKQELNLPVQKIKSFVSEFYDHLNILRKFSEWMIDKAKTEKDDVSAAANDYLKTLGYVSIAYAWIKVLEVSFKDFNENKNFYEDKIDTARFYFDKVLPRAEQHYKSAISGSSNIMSFKFS